MAVHPPGGWLEKALENVIESYQKDANDPNQCIKPHKCECYKCFMEEWNAAHPDSDDEEPLDLFDNPADDLLSLMTPGKIEGEEQKTEEKDNVVSRWLDSLVTPQSTSGSTSSGVNGDATKDNGLDDVLALMTCETGGTGQNSCGNEGKGGTKEPEQANLLRDGLEEEGFTEQEKLEGDRRRDKFFAEKSALPDEPLSLKRPHAEETPEKHQDVKRHRKLKAPTRRLRKKARLEDNDDEELGMSFLSPDRFLRLPLIFGCIVAALMAGINPPQKTLDVLEVFSGVGRIVSTAQEDYGLQARGFDLIHGTSEDVNTTPGFITLIRLVLSLKPGALATWGTPCSTWVSINAGTSGRTNNFPQGHEWIPSVQQANEQVARMVLLLLLMVYMAVQWLLEQPGSSKMPLSDYLWAFLRAFPHFRIPVCMGCYGHDLLKQSILIGSSRWMAGLSKSSSELTPEQREEKHKNAERIVITSVDEHGIKHFSGTDLLKETQEYTQEFATAVVSQFVNDRKTRDGQPEPINLDIDLGGYNAENLFVDAHLEQVFVFVRDNK